MRVRATQNSCWSKLLKKAQVPVVFRMLGPDGSTAQYSCCCTRTTEIHPACRAVDRPSEPRTKWTCPPDTARRPKLTNDTYEYWQAAQLLLPFCSHLPPPQTPRPCQSNDPLIHHALCFSKWRDVARRAFCQRATEPYVLKPSRLCAMMGFWLTESSASHVSR
jgi:hypothetical protein